MFLTQTNNNNLYNFDHKFALKDCKLAYLGSISNEIL